MFERTRSLLQRLTHGRQDESDERRAWERYSSFHETTIHHDGEGTRTLTARIEDVSRGGTRLLVEQPIAAGSMIRIDLPPLNGNPHTSVLACVVHAKSVADELYALGCSFSTELSDVDLGTLGARKIKPSSPDQRAWDRVPVEGRARYRIVRGEGELKAAAIHNISPTGVALLVSENVEPGTLIDIELQSAAGRSVVTILACVVYKTDAAVRQWLVGCNFIRELDDHDLQALIAPPEQE
jgi:c-di-GMP-binding flagellar brake protein YcgR